ncbi:uncharacterized protein [Clytia hemisphaerica]|uniref:USP domain-containing protein n=1 Tax=Clytia hemisphaerica TaxID=252671 RepID=A0A7M5UKQ2_9CNID|eukprot:TCONS_00011837-protein
METAAYQDELEDQLGSFPKSFSFENDLKSHVSRPRLESRMSICLPSKGFVNGPGENNCFLNAAIQLLWHVNVFRRSFRLLDGHVCVENACIFCSLKKVFKQLEGSDESVIAADDMRLAMANAFVDERRFQLGRMDDAAECFENILTRLHFHTARNEAEESCSVPHCIPHQKFANHILEQTFCKCKATSEPKPYYQFVYYVAASALVQQAKICQHEKRPLVLGDLLKRTSQYGDIRPCPDEKRCKYKGHPENLTRIENTLLNRPDVVTVGIIWDTDSPSSSYIVDVMDCISERLFMVDLFDHVLDEDYKRVEMKLTGVVTYYGRHYTSFFYNIREKQWLFFDDAQVSKIGPSWSNVKHKCERTRFQPLLIVFTNGTGSLVNTEQALPITEIVSKEVLLKVHPIVKPPHRSKHKNRKHKKHRHTSNRSSPLPSPDKTSERTSSRSSNGSPAPSPRLNLTDTFDHKYVTKLNDDPSYSRPPKALLNMKGSASADSIVDMANGDYDFVDSSHRKRSGSMKKRVGNVFKSMKNPKSSKTKTQSASTPSPDIEAPMVAADVGFTSPYNKRSHTKETPQQPPPRSPKSPHRSRQPPRSPKMHHTMLSNSEPEDSPKMQRKNVKNLSSKPSEDSPKTQIKNLEAHKDNLGKSSHGHKTHRHQNGHTSKSSRSSPVIEDRFSESDHSPQHSQPPPRNDLIHFNSRPVVVDDYKQNAEALALFQDLLSRGEMHMQNAEVCERKGDLLYALRWCTEATLAFRDASRVPGISPDLQQYVDSKRNQSFVKSQQLQHEVDAFLRDEVPSPYNHAELARANSTSGYSSMSDGTIISEYSTTSSKPSTSSRQMPPPNYYDREEERHNPPPPPIPARQQQQQNIHDIHDMINQQNISARHQALQRVRQNHQPPSHLPSPSSPQRQWTTSSVDSIRRASFGILPQQQARQRGAFPPPQGAGGSNTGGYRQPPPYGSQTLPNPHRGGGPSIKWVVDKPNNEHQPEDSYFDDYHSKTSENRLDDDTDRLLKEVPQNLQKPEIPTGGRSPTHDYSPTTIYDNDLAHSQKSLTVGRYNSSDYSDSTRNRGNFGDKTYDDPPSQTHKSVTVGRYPDSEHPRNRAGSDIPTRPDHLELDSTRNRDYSSDYETKPQNYITSSNPEAREQNSLRPDSIRRLGQGSSPPTSSYHVSNTDRKTFSRTSSDASESRLPANRKTIEESRSSVGTTSFNDTLPEPRKPFDRTKDDVRNTRSESFNSVSSHGSSSSKPLYIEHPRKPFDPTLNDTKTTRSGSVNSVSSNLSDSTPKEIPRMLEEPKDRRQEARSIYDNIEYNDKDLFKERLGGKFDSHKNDINKTTVNSTNKETVGITDKIPTIVNTPQTIYDDTSNTDEVTNKETRTPSASELIKRLNNQNKTENNNCAKIATAGSLTVKTNQVAPKMILNTETVQMEIKSNTPSTNLVEITTKDIVNRFNHSLHLQPNSSATDHKADANTLQRLTKEGRISARCRQCKWRKVENEGDFCKECRTEYLSTLKKRVTGPETGAPPSDTLEKLRRGNTKKYKCIQCGWRQVEYEDGYCENCQSEYL